MLPPILSVSNTTVQHKVPPRQEHDGHPRGGQGQTPGERNRQGSVAVSNAAAGRVNVLNLAGPEIMAMDLSKLSEAIAKALDMPAAPGENAAMHALRLAAALLDLNAGPRMALERQLSHLLQGLSLQLVALALKNPGGPEAARIAAYLELGRQKGDPATQAVVASYQQNEASDEESLLTLAIRSARPEIELKGMTGPFLYESQLSQAALSAAQRAGIALPYVNYAIEEAPAEEEAEHQRHGSHGGGDHAGEEASEDEGFEQSASEGEEEDDEVSLSSAPEGEDGDDLAYVYYQRMSGGL